jgi:hypothetical protein
LSCGSAGRRRRAAPRRRCTPSPARSVCPVLFCSPVSPVSPGGGRAPVCRGLRPPIPPVQSAQSPPLAERKKTFRGDGVESPMESGPGRGPALRRGANTVKSECSSGGMSCLSLEGSCGGHKRPRLELEAAPASALGPDAAKLEVGNLHQVTIAETSGAQQERQPTSVKIDAAHPTIDHCPCSLNTRMPTPSARWRRSGWNRRLGTQ